MEPAAVSAATSLVPWFAHDGDASAAAETVSPRDLHAWRECLREIGPRLLLFARQWAPLPADAEDIVQDAFVRCWRRHRERAIANPALFFAAVRSSALDFLRRERRRRHREQTAGAEATTTAFFENQTAGDAGRIAALEAAMQTLPAAQREVLVLKVWGELTFAQIAEVLGIPPDTAASRARYALAALRKQLVTPAIL
ncbi:MAG: sigma-70 family RNA polymerase sigma factor [Verrucomicrobia bacterium]|nr:sigma-70 family RNA polymerase sigma factor [Verrucomicrobiota bacterium]